MANTRTARLSAGAKGGQQFMCFYTRICELQFCRNPAALASLAVCFGTYEYTVWKFGYGLNRSHRDPSGEVNVGAPFVSRTLREIGSGLFITIEQVYAFNQGAIFWLAVVCWCMLSNVWCLFLIWTIPLRRPGCTCLHLKAKRHGTKSFYIQYP